MELIYISVSMFYNNAMSNDGNTIFEGPCILYIKVKVKVELAL
jgi:hypothetical protein